MIVAVWLFNDAASRSLDAFGRLKCVEGEGAMEIDEATRLVIREALRRLGPGARLDIVLLEEKIAEVVKQEGETIFAKLSNEAREQLRREGRLMNEQAVHLDRISEAIEYGRLLVAKYNVETLGELPREEQIEFARLWTNAGGGAKVHEN